MGSAVSNSVKFSVLIVLTVSAKARPSPAPSVAVRTNISPMKTYIALGFRNLMALDYRYDDVLVNLT